LNFQLDQIEKEASFLDVKNVNLLHPEKELKKSEEQNILIRKNTVYYPLVLQDVQNAILQNHLIKLILLLKQDVNQDLDLTVGIANVNTPKELWQENVTALKRKILLRLLKLNIENLIKEERDITKEMLSEIICIEEMLLSGLKSSGKNVNYTLETNVFIVDQKNFLLKTILSLYQAMIVLEPSKEISFPPVLNVIVQKDLNSQKIGVTVNQLKEFQNTSKLSIKLNHKATCFVNPPYDRINKPLFIKKAFEEWEKGKTVVMLLPSATGTKQFHEIILPHAEIRFVKGRIAFHGLNTKGEFSTKNKGKHDSMIVIFRK